MYGLSTIKRLNAQKRGWEHPESSRYIVAEVNGSRMTFFDRNLVPDDAKVVEVVGSI